MTDVRAVVDAILKDADDINVVLTPMVWHPSKTGKAWSFTASTCKNGEWHSIKIEDHDYEPPGYIDPVLVAAADRVFEILTDTGRSVVKRALLGRKPIVVHDCDDELYAVKLCEHLWPGKRVSNVRQLIERERAAA